MSEIRLFRTDSGLATELAGSNVALEKHLQSLMEKILDAFLGQCSASDIEDTLCRTPSGWEIVPAGLCRNRGLLALGFLLRLLFAAG